MGVLGNAAKAAVSGLGDTQTVADALTSAINAYGESTLSASHATDVLVATVKAGKGEADTLAGSIGNVSALAAQLGVSFNDVGASLAALTQLGIDAQTASVELQQVFSNLIKVTPQAEKAFKSVGLSAEGLRKEFADKGLLAGLNTIKTAFSGNLTALAKAVLRTFEPCVVSWACRNPGWTYHGDLPSARQRRRQTNKAFAAISRSPEQKFRQLSAAVNVLKIRVGAALLPSINSTVSGMVKWLSQTRNQVAVTNTLKNVIGGAVSVIRTFATIVNQVVGIMGGWRMSIELVVGAWASLKAINLARTFIGAAVAAGRLVSTAKTVVAVWTGASTTINAELMATYTNGEAGAAAVAAANTAAAAETAAAWRAALISTGFGALAIAAGIAAAYVITHWKKVKGWFGEFWRYVKATGLAAWQELLQTAKSVTFAIAQYATLGIRAILEVASHLPFVGGKARDALNAINGAITI